ncbi:hypothetical protein Ancab_006093 [Ancistrocladus abbreviatus]
MESILLNIKTHNLFALDSSASIFAMETGGVRANLQPPPIHLNQQLNGGVGSGQLRKRGGAAAPGLVAKCAKMSNSSLVMELERELEEIEKEGKEEQRNWRELKKNCMRMGEEKGLVEVLECLEKEAIMGEDEGRDPVDYNRRALIFDRSSKVFQALQQEDSRSP